MATDLLVNEIGTVSDNDIADASIDPDAPRGFSRKYKLVLIAVLIIGMIATGVVARIRLSAGSRIGYVTKQVAQGDINESVEATGTINAVTTVLVGAQDSGIIAKLYADFNDHVKKGQLLAQIDPRVYEGQLLQARANVDNACANVAAAKANLENAKAKGLQAKADLDRATVLTKETIMSRQNYDAAKATSDSAEAQVHANESALIQADAQVLQQDAALKVAETNLAYTNIYAPIDGTVINRAVDVGQTVAATFQTPTLFTIAQDLTKMQLHISTDEGDIGMVRKGASVNFRVDAFPGMTFHGQISQVRMNSTTVQNVVTHETIVDFGNPDQKLFPGMTAYATIPVRSESNVLNVPNAAVRFNPHISKEELVRLLAQSGISPNEVAHSNEASAGGEKVISTVLWKVEPDGKLSAVLVQTGITDHTSTAVLKVLKGLLKAGDPVATAEKPKAPGF